jgi:hypothetical protein
MHTDYTDNLDKGTYLWNTQRRERSRTAVPATTTAYISEEEIKGVCIYNIEAMAYNRTSNSLTIECSVNSADALEFANSPDGPVISKVRVVCCASPWCIHVGREVEWREEACVT